jgi:branched-chain amino acid transport system substrate-binding protein
VTTVDRRRLLALATGLVAKPYLARAQNTPIKIGAVLPQQGPFALYGEAAGLGMKIALEMAGGKIMGSPVQLIVYDDPNPAGAQQNVNKLIESDKVCALIGGMTSASALAISSVGAAAKVPTIVPQATVRDITGKSCSKYVFRVNAFTKVYTSLMAPQLQSYGKRWYFLVGAYAYGQEVYQLMKDELAAAGGQDVGMDAVPVGTTDFSSYILKIRQSNPDAIVLGVAGSDLSAYLKQHQEFGQRTLLAIPALSDEELWALQPSHPALLVGKFWHYNNPDNSPEEAILNAAVNKATGHPATLGCVTSWISLRMLQAAIESAQSTNPLAIARGLEQARSPGVRGYFREWDHQMIWRPIVARVRDKIVDRFDDISILSEDNPPVNVEALYGTRDQSVCKMSDA